MSLDGWFFATAERFADEVALEVDDVSLTYRRLAEVARRLAGLFTATAGGGPRAVALVASRSVTAYAGYLGALRAGAGVVPVGVDAVAGRAVDGCAAAGVDLVVTDASGAATGAELARALGVPLLELAGDRWYDGLSTVDEIGPRKAADVAYTLFTSGSTGRPKGVPIRHRQLGDYLEYCRHRYAMAPGCRASQTFELTFDPSVHDLFVTWSGGGTVVVPRREELFTPARFVTERRLTHWFSVPSVISLARGLRGLAAGSMPALRWSLFAGEQLTLDQARAWAAAAPASTIENLYGPTELTITCTSFRLPAEATSWPDTPNGTVPIGRPYPHLEATVSAGELWMRGSQRFDGYLDPADDAGAFAPATGGAWYRTGDRVAWHAGELVHIGRVDDQVKINGHRVEPAEVEAVLRQCPGVRDVAVVAVDSGGGRLGLCAAYSGDGVGEAELVGHLRRRLPPYLVPAQLRHLDKLPTNANGKVDRHRLRELMYRAHI